MNTSPSPIILALDVPTQDQAFAWVHRLYPRITIFKVGMQLFYRYGPDLVTEIRNMGADIFLDLKLHDIPNTVAKACESILPLDVRFLTVHLSGGFEMLSAAQSVIFESRTQLLGVTALTSLNDDALKAIYPDFSITASQWAIHLSELALKAGLAGVVCSAQEDAMIRQQCGKDFIMVNPGIRPSGSARQDQQRVMTPRQAMEAGADYLVIGRPILEAEDPEAMAMQIQEEIQLAAGLSPRQA